MSNYLEDLFLRVVEMEKEAIPGSDSAGYFFYWQEAFPYWTNRLGDDVIAFDSEDYDLRTYTVILRYIVAHLSEGQPGAPEDKLYTDIPAIEDYFIARPNLQSATYPNIPRYIAPNGAVFQRSSGLRIFDSAGILARQVGVEFTLSVPFHLTVEYAFT